MWKEKKSLYTADSMRAYVVHIRYRIMHYQLDGVDSPERLSNELKTAKILVRLESKYHE